MKSSTRGTEGQDPTVRATLVYDADCSSCSLFAAAVRAFDRGRRIGLASMHDAAVEARLRPRLGAAYDAAFHLEFAPSGEVLSGEAALPALARLLPLLRPVATVVFALPGLKRVPAALYGSLARNRRCALAPPPA